MISEISGVEGSRKEEKGLMCGGDSDKILGGGCEPRCWWIFWIFSLKKDISELQKAAEHRWDGRESGGWMMFLNRENSAFVLPSLERIISE